MNRLTKALTNSASKLFARTTEVTAVTEHGAHFRSIELTGASFHDVTWNVGDKIQVRTGSRGFTMRTYTPISWDTTRGSTTLLTYAHGDGPGSTWARTVATGSRCQFFGPFGSLKLDDPTKPILFVGDETSFALVAAWHGQNSGVPPVAELFEVTDPGESRIALEAIGLPSARLFPRDQGSAHLDELITTLVGLLRVNGEATLCLTGKAQTIAAIRRELKSAGLADRPTKVKAYWDENRTGLD